MKFNFAKMSMISAVLVAGACGSAVLADGSGCTTTTPCFQHRIHRVPRPADVPRNSGYSPSEINDSASNGSQSVSTDRIRKMEYIYPSHRLLYQATTVNYKKAKIIASQAGQGHGNIFHRIGFHISQLVSQNAPLRSGPGTMPMNTGALPF